MTITIRNTEALAEINGARCRVWVGKTDTGIEVQCLVSRIMAPKAADCSQFQRELLEEAAEPLRVIL